MTIQDCIDYVDGIEPNAYNNAQKAAWVNECEGKVYTRLFLVQPYEYKTVTQQLALPAPYDRMYPRYLQAMIHYADGEYNRYQNSYAMFNEVWAEANRWFGGDFDVTDRLRNQRVDIDITQACINNRNSDVKLLDIPEGCAFVAGRIYVKNPLRFDNFIYVLDSALPAGTYSFRNAEKNWLHFTTESAAAAGDTMDFAHGSYVSVNSEHADVSLGKSGTELDFIPVPIKVKMDDTEIASVIPLDRGVAPLPMLMADSNGGGLAIAQIDSYHDTVWEEQASGSQIYLTGRMLIPADRWYYEDQYARRRDARWHG